VQRTAAAIRLNRQVSELGSEEVAPPGGISPARQKMARRFKDHPRTAGSHPRDRRALPGGAAAGASHFRRSKVGEGETPLRRYGVRHWKGRGGGYHTPLDVQARLPEAIQRRLDHELSVIAERGYESLFLVMEEIVGFARSSGIPIASPARHLLRLVAHCWGDHARSGGLNLYLSVSQPGGRATPAGHRHRPCARGGGMMVIEFCLSPLRR